MEHENLSQEQVRHIVARLIERANDSLEDFQKHPKEEYFQGHRIAYYEVLDILKSELTFADQNLAEFGLDIDLEKTFL